MGCLKLHIAEEPTLRLAYSKKEIKPSKKVGRFYPFGMKIEGINNVINGVENNYQTYNGKELEESLGYNMYEYEFRHYDAAIGRFVTIDPLAENYAFQTPYAYAANNPIFFIDKLGMGPDWINNGDGTWTAEAGDSASTLATQAGISFEKAKEIMANTPKDNPQGNMGTYIDKNDGIEKSAVDPGDVVRVSNPINRSPNSSTWETTETPQEVTVADGKMVVPKTALSDITTTHASAFYGSGSGGSSYIFIHKSGDIVWTDTLHVDIDSYVDSESTLLERFPSTAGYRNIEHHTFNYFTPSAGDKALNGLNKAIGVGNFILDAMDLSRTVNTSKVKTYKNSKDYKGEALKEHINN